MLAVALIGALTAGCAGEPGGDRSATGSTNRVAADEVLDREPYMGVSCRTANSFACDRVGLAVWLRDPAASVDAAIAGRELHLDDPDWSEPVEDGERRMFAGFLQPAGLVDGPLQLTPDDGPDRWIGRQPVSANVDLWIVGRDGGTTTTSAEVDLSPGWG